ncbi:MAG: efflux RND transporter periplasmic adaptor subunit [Deltaproteobacteria bacterium]|nr:efflux RND transporter periplasmic adaptor subunit [Deltaproteobacteria bacterium]
MPSPSSTKVVPISIASLVAMLLVGLLLMRMRADARTNQVALADSAKPVTVVRARASQFQPTRAYVGTLEPWIEAKIGPQFVAAYVDTVLVRPGAVVKKGAVLATLDCRSANATAQAIEMQARSLDAQQRALADEAHRVSSMLDGGFVSPTEAEGKTAQSEAKQADLLAAKAKLLDTSLAVNDCVLRAPFDGEVANRWLDPGAFVRPGEAIVSVVDRATVRYVADVPEDDFDAVPPGKSGALHVLASKQDLQATIARRAPSADPGTRTVRIEADISDPDRRIPVFTTGEFTIGVGEPKKAIELPLASATIRGQKAVVYVVANGVAKVTPLAYQGELGGSVFVEPNLAADALVVTEGRALLSDGDKVDAKIDEPAQEVRR